MPSLKNALRTYLQVGYRKATHEHYQLVLTKMIEAIGPAREVTRVTYEDLLDYQAQLRERVKPSTVAHYTNIFKIFFNWCVDRHYIESSPARDLKAKQPDRDTTRQWAVPSSDLMLMVEQARKTSPRNFAIILFLADTGCRVGALCSMTLANLNLEEGFAMVVEKGGKWHKARFGEETALALVAWLKVRPQPDPNHDYVWTSNRPYQPFSIVGVRQMIRRLSELSGASRGWYPHAVRHSVGESYANAGIPVSVTQRKLGHSSPVITLRIYYPHSDEQVNYISRRYSLLSLKGSELDQTKEDEAPPRRNKIIPF